jgi:hypothetical protein
LDKEFTQFCELNNIIDIDKQAQETFNRGFSLLKYGEIPNGNKIREIVEVPKETIKEVIVEKIVEVTREVFNNSEIDKLKSENEKLRNELDKITSSLNNLGKGRMMKKSDLSNLYDE